jgi:hypothetical protein
MKEVPRQTAALATDRSDRDLKEKPASSQNPNFRARGRSARDLPENPAAPTKSKVFCSAAPGPPQMSALPPPAQDLHAHL